MRSFITVAALICFAVLLGTSFGQDKKDDKKEVTLKGRIVCNKCELMNSKECETVIVVKDDKTKKDVIIFFDKAADDKYHLDICGNAKKGSVVGTVKDVDKKKIVAVKKVTYE